MKCRIAVRAAALAAGVAMAGAASLAGPGTAKASTALSRNLVFQSPKAGGILSIAAISKTNVWAVGQLNRGANIIYEPCIQHFNGSTWKTVTIPGARMTSDDVQATSASDVWVFGQARNPQNIASCWRELGRQAPRRR